VRIPIGRRVLHNCLEIALPQRILLKIMLADAPGNRNHLGSEGCRGATYSRLKFIMGSPGAARPWWSKKRTVSDHGWLKLVPPTARVQWREPWMQSGSRGSDGLIL